MSAPYEAIPADDHGNGLTSLVRLIGNGATIRAAVAFVTRSGVSRLAELVADLDVDIELVARASDATDPDALLALRDDLGADVSVVIGRDAARFHPKLWLISGSDSFAVMSGSGNLTEGGLVRNDEQFEVLRFSPDSPEVAVHLDRYEFLTRRAQPLNAIEGSAIWREWLDVRKRQASLRRQISDIEKNLASRDPIPDRISDRKLLIEDLQRIYDDTVDARLARADGGRYAPTRLLGAIKRARDGDRDPVKLVADTIRRRTEGLDILLRAGRADLTLEWLVLDASKPYHDLFTPRSLELAAARMEAFGVDAPPEQADSSPRPLSPGSTTRYDMPEPAAGRVRELIGRLPNDHQVAFIEARLQLDVVATRVDEIVAALDDVPAREFRDDAHRLLWLVCSAWGHGHEGLKARATKIATDGSPSSPVASADASAAGSPPDSRQ